MLKPITEADGYNLAQLDYELDVVKTAAFLDKSAAFLGPLMCGMDFVWTKDIPTAATDGVTIFWNPDWFQKIPKKSRETVFVHELWHPADLHFLRRGDRDPTDWNHAGDININNGLERDGYSFEGLEGCWKDQKYWGMAVEDIYEDVKQTPPPCAPWGPGTEPPEDGSGLGDMLDNATPEQQQKIINNVVQAIHAADAANEPGAVPGHVRQTVNKFLRPIVPWDVMFARFFEDRCQDDYSYSRPNRRYPDIYMPSLQADQRLVHIIFYEDVSGSITDAECLRFNSEVKHIKDRYNPEKLTLVQFDTKIQSEVTLTENDVFDEVVIVGRGGTCLKEVRDHIMKHNPTCAVIFSDLWVQPMEPGPKCPILWVAVNNKDATVPFGQLIHINA